MSSSFQPQLSFSSIVRVFDFNVGAAWSEGAGHGGRPVGGDLNMSTSFFFFVDDGVKHTLPPMAFSGGG
eukprot:11998483-Prorocentrum_lima.AAC.1